jgi:uncharacterized protein
LARFSLIPKDGRFYDDFIAMAQEIQAATHLLVRMLASDPPDWSIAAELKRLEHHCDQLAHDSLRRLNQTFVTPIDREDIHAMALSLDDVMDMIDAAGGCLHLYEVRQVRPGARELADNLVLCGDQLLLAMRKLERRQDLAEHVVEINRLENEADLLHREAIGRLFRETPDPIEIMKWKEILDLLERATDDCEDVANLIESVLVKYS